MSAEFLLRFDDLCATQNWQIWDAVEALLDEHGVRPIVALVPDNADPALVQGPPNPEFWDRARAWQDKGWTLALHGYRHLYSTEDAGLVGWRPKSEFAGVPVDEQRRMIKAGMAILHREGLRVETWVAPGHTFDAATLEVLDEVGITRISDGFFLFPHCDKFGRFWMPQQAWRFRRVPLGVWTVCCHTNSWTEAQVRAFGVALGQYKAQLKTWGEIELKYGQRRRSGLDLCFQFIYRRLMVYLAGGSVRIASR